MKHYYKYSNLFDVLRLTFFDGFMIAWLFYGNLLFYSDENDCSKHSNTQFLNVLMKIILIVGYLTIALYFFFMCSVPFILFN